MRGLPRHLVKNCHGTDNAKKSLRRCPQKKNIGPKVREISSFFQNVCTIELLTNLQLIKIPCFLLLVRNCNGKKSLRRCPKKNIWKNFSLLKIRKIGNFVKQISP